MLNLTFGWIWITMGFLSGAMLGMGFHKEQFMGGYNSWPRRLARLGHVAFFGTGFLNLMFALTGMHFGESFMDGGVWLTASWCFLLGGLWMPVCCFLASAQPKLKWLFVFPVVLLTVAGVLTSLIMLQLGAASLMWTYGDVA